MRLQTNRTRPDSPAAWATTVANREVAEHYRTQEKTVEIHIDAGVNLEEIPGCDPTRPGAIDPIDAKRGSAWLDRVLEAGRVLSPRKAQLVGYARQGLTAAEIAQLTGLSEDRVRNALSESTRKLRRRYASLVAAAVFVLLMLALWIMALEPIAGRGLGPSHRAAPVPTQAAPAQTPPPVGSGR